MSDCYSKTYDWLVLGDSVSSGYGVDDEDLWVNKVHNNLSCPVELLNLSVQGLTSKEGVYYLNHFYENNHAKNVIIELGGNDALRGLQLAALQNNLAYLINKALDEGSSVLLVAVDLPPNYGDIYIDRFQSVYNSLALSKNVPLVRLRFPKDLKFLQKDGLHPNVAGHNEITDVMMPVLEAWLCTQTIVKEVV